jgi:hypothetical protein
MIAAFMKFITSPVAGPLGAILAGVLALSLGVVEVQRRAAVERADQLHAAINDEETGYKVRLDRCRSNTAALTSSLQAQNEKVDALSHDSAARLKAAEAALARARTVTDKANAQIAVLMSRPPVGVDTCARVLDVDGRVKEMLEQ